MTDDRHRQNPSTDPQNLQPQNPKVQLHDQTKGSSSSSSSSTNHFKPNYPNPPEISNPDAATLRGQWKYAIRQYSKWYSHAWGTAILAGLSFFALGWVIKGGNPIPSFHQNHKHEDASMDSSGEDKTP